MWSWLNKAQVAAGNTIRKAIPGIRTPLTAAEVAEHKQRMKFRRTWQCGCGSTMTISSPVDRPMGNEHELRFHPEGHESHRHAIVPAGRLSWAELAEERGWSSDPVRCPACRCGLTRDEYKEIRRQIARLELIGGKAAEIAQLTARIQPAQRT